MYIAKEQLIQQIRSRLIHLESLPNNWDVFGHLITTGRAYLDGVPMRVICICMNGNMRGRDYDTWNKNSDFSILSVEKLLFILKKLTMVEAELKKQEKRAAKNHRKHLKVMAKRERKEKRQARKDERLCRRYLRHIPTFFIEKR